MLVQVSLDDEGLDSQEVLDVWRYDDRYEEHEATWAEVKKEILGDEEAEAAAAAAAESADGDAMMGGAGTGGEGDEEPYDEATGATIVPAGEAPPELPSLASSSAAAGGAGTGGAGGVVGMEIADLSESDLIALRRTIYLTIMNSLDFEVRPSAHPPTLTAGCIYEAEALAGPSQD